LEFEVTLWSGLALPSQSSIVCNFAIQKAFLQHFLSYTPRPFHVIQMVTKEQKRLHIDGKFFIPSKPISLLISGRYSVSNIPTN